METLGMPELLVILGVAVLLFGGKKIPELAKGWAKGFVTSRLHSRVNPKNRRNRPRLSPKRSRPKRSSATSLYK